MLVKPKTGDVVYVDSRASVQFGGNRALIFRVTKVCDKPTYYGWAWLTGYVLDRAGAAVDRREIFVLTDGLRLLTSAATAVAPKRTAKPVKQAKANERSRKATTTNHKI